MVKWVILIVGGVVALPVFWVAIIEFIMWRISPPNERVYIKYKWWYRLWVRWRGKRNKRHQAKLRAEAAERKAQDYIEKNKPRWVK